MGEVSAVTSRDYRQTMGLFPTGVAILIIEDGDRNPIGMTVNSLTSVSLNPLILLVCVQKTAHMIPALLEAKWFTFSFLPETRSDLSSYFAGIWDHDAPAPQFGFSAMGGWNTA